MQGLEVLAIPLFPVVKTIEFTTSGGVKLKVQRRQVTLDRAHAFTDYQSQGQMINYLFTDISMPLKGWLTPFNVYVTLLRAWGRDNVRLIWDFEDSLFTTTPCELLEK